MAPTLPKEAGEDPLKVGQTAAPPWSAEDCVSDETVSGETRELRVLRPPATKKLAEGAVEKLRPAALRVGQSAAPLWGAEDCVSVETVSVETSLERIFDLSKIWANDMLTSSGKMSARYRDCSSDD